MRNLCRAQRNGQVNAQRLENTISRACLTSVLQRTGRGIPRWWTAAAFIRSVPARDIQQRLPASPLFDPEAGYFRLETIYFRL